MSAQEQHGRLSVELRLLGLLGGTWLLAAGHATAWAWLATGRPDAIVDLPWAMLVLPQAIAASVTGAALYFDLPTARWRRTIERRPVVAPLLIAGLGLIAFAPLFVFRNRRAIASPPPSKEEAYAAFDALLRLPRTLALRYTGWAAAAFVVDAIIVGHQLGWERDRTFAVALLWVALLTPTATLLGGYARIIVRPAYLSAQRPEHDGSPRTDLRLRMTVVTVLATTGAILAPLCVGYVLSGAQPTADALAAARQLQAAARPGPSEALGRALAEHPEATVRIGARQLGASRGAIPEGVGILDDPAPSAANQLAVARDGDVVVAVPVPPLPPAPVLGFAVAGLLLLAAATIASVRIARDTHRDVVQTTRRLRAVIDGQRLKPAKEGAFATRELRTLVASVDRLVDRIAEANIAKYVAIEKAKEVDRLKSQFLANMSHDLRSPLNSILGFSELLLSGIDGDLGPPQRELVSTILENGRSLLQEIDDILDTAKIDASRLDLHPEPTPPATMVNRAIAAARKRQSKKKIEYVVDAAAGLPPTFCDPYRTVQAIENVLVFASERMTHGRVDVNVRLGKTDRGRMIFVQVRTPVRPATAAQLARARRGFFRIPGHRGLGLGLPLAGSILELEGGALGIEDLDDGMVFSLQLSAPAARRGPRPTDPLRVAG